LRIPEEEVDHDDEAEKDKCAVPKVFKIYYHPPAQEGLSTKPKLPPMS
jgi:hypothetical protein